MEWGVCVRLRLLHCWNHLRTIISTSEYVLPRLVCDVRHQGGNLYPYVSEVIRDGIFKLIFIIGCSVGLIPSMIFATNYFKVMTRYNHRQTNSFIRFCVTIINVVELLLFYYSAVSVIGVAYCDMDTYPDQHTLFSFSWVILTNVMELIQLVQMKCTLYKNSTRSLHS